MPPKKFDITQAAFFKDAIEARIAKERKREKVKLWSKAKRPLTESRWEFYLSKCHYKQKLFLRDDARYKALLCPRRTGKTTVTLLESAKAADEYPGSTIAYVVPTSKGHARRLFWRPLRELDREFGLGYQFFEAEKRVATPSKAQIILLGANDKDSPAMLRGDAYSLVILDECKDFGPHFEELMIEAVLPGLEDYGGTLILAGTPGEIMEGHFYEVTTGQRKGWSVHKWIKSDNTFLIPKARDLEYIESVEYKPFGLDKRSPKFRREQLAEWCKDTTNKLYQFDMVRNTFDGHLPSGHDWKYVLGLDLGEKDANAFCVGAFANTHPNLFVVYDYARSFMSIDEIAEKTQWIMQMYSPLVSMVADTGGYGRGIVTDLINRFSLSFEPAGKGRDKLGRIAVLNSDLQAGRIKINKEFKLCSELQRLTKTYRQSDNKPVLGHSDRGDAFLYMYGASLHWAHRSFDDDAELHVKFAHLTPEQIRMYKQEQKEIALAVSKRQRGQDIYGSESYEHTLAQIEY